MKNKIKCAIIGCGRIALKHFEAINQHQDSLQLAAVCDTNAELVKQIATDHNCSAYDSLSDLLRQSSAELIILCTPSGLHANQTSLCAAAGKHVMTEKPMATRWQDGLKMVKDCDDAGVELFVVKQNRRNTTLQLLKNAIEKKRFGKIYMVQVNVFWTRPQDYYDQAKWRGTWEFDGGALMNQASHYIDLLDWLIGPVKSVQSMIGTLARDIEVEDTAVMNIKWRSGALGSVSVTMLTYPKNMEGSITILGEKGTVKVGGVAVNEIEHWEFEDSDPDDQKIQEASYETTSVYGFGHPLYYKNVIDTLNGDALAETDGREGLRSLELLIASYLSARDGEKISLPLEY
ncbi:MAG: Gfo/Idh/MocA family oxidoreductase [gamma proteobacterium symbiont of Bathyaustriella thionipta]|nr:Gfo/Idh/MocA family oxidoreductase [gamma proteobacterium symbiont of Bathyaustriella thionipta]MCU7948708.1 Gfo/Idh/MocA family oxidoreductase [gamma proteobacterium symbiont of Bathyaustriella thionipta]MCU7953885.1 Gfo/Idh/MocA family oxidoreductase [gamma proteobacterium symbiont of Bathyaustriella thionipta]MCU7955019.1 Gfo/Idh/MocA family oxidoreductase [gamma proteobacterium symbiont of Bathyaustriella thionipta]MCU7966872.1 Gfo/Idh/MocA family oxidoreductase [gamma proteobacterium sy